MYTWWWEWCDITIQIFMPSFDRDHRPLGGLHDQQKCVRSCSWGRQVQLRNGRIAVAKNWSPYKSCPKLIMKTAFCHIFFIFPVKFVGSGDAIQETNSYGSCLLRSMQIWISVARFDMCHYALPLNMYLQTERRSCNFERLHKQKLCYWLKQQSRLVFKAKTAKRSQKF